jgi:glycosidase
MEELRALVETGHRKNLNLLIDYVANHVHQENPIYAQHPDWATPLHLPDGSLNTERWDEHRLTTWFDVFMPTLELRDPKIAEPMADTALAWITDYGFDGYRHDATKHISEVYWRALTLKLKDSIRDREVFQIGETYGSPDLIASYLSSGMLDAQFDFNVYDAAVGAFSGQLPLGSALARLVEVERSSLATYGSHNRMGYISGNQDRARFISFASGQLKLSDDAKLVGWTRDIGLPNDTAFRRLAMLHAFNMAIPGIPVIYYGDEIGLHGAGDPDNRKMMRFEGLNALENALREDVIRLAHLRRSSMPLTYGSTEMGVLSGDVLYVKRSYFDRSAVILINPNANSVSIDPKLIPSNLKPQFGKLSSESGDFILPALSFEYLL